MRILFITHYDNMYGANRALYKLIYLLKTKYGHEPYLVIPAEGEMTRKLSEIGVKFYISFVTQWQADYTTALRFTVKKFLRRRAIKKEVNNLYEVYKDEHIDVIHSNSSVVGHGAMLARRLNCRHVWHIREFAKEHFNMKYFYSMDKVSAYYSEAEGLIAISDALKKNYELRYPKAKVYRVYDGVSDHESIGTEEKVTVSTNEEVEASPHDDRSGSCTRFVYAGYLFHMKHQEHVIEACKILKDSGVTDYKVYFAGSGKAEYIQHLQKMIDERGLQNNVFLSGYVDNMSEFMGTMDCGIIASEYEGFGLVTVEYMLHSLPVIGFDSGATPEIVVNNVTGLIYSNIIELAACMQKIMQDRKMAEELGKNGRIRAVSEFSEEKNAESIMEIFYHE